MFASPLFWSFLLLCSLTACSNGNSAPEGEEQERLSATAESNAALSPSTTPEQDASPDNSPAESEDEVRQPEEILQGMQELEQGAAGPSSPNNKTNASAAQNTVTASEPGSKEAATRRPTQSGSSESKPKREASEKKPQAAHKDESSSPAAGLSHSIWDDLLQKHVSSSGRVDYRGFKRDEVRLGEYLEHLAQNPPSNWSKQKEMAYWINLYNAATIQLILRNYPVKSIRDLDGGNPWDVRRVRSGPRMYTLNQIEKEILLKRFKEPRVHFAVNCAAASCPPLLNRAWTASNLERYFEQQTKSFINNEKYNQLSARRLELSKIFDWYQSDFGNVLDFVQSYARISINDNARIKYLEYDWSLND